MVKYALVTVCLALSWLFAWYVNIERIMVLPMTIGTDLWIIITMIIDATKTVIDKIQIKT